MPSISMNTISPDKTDGEKIIAMMAEAMKFALRLDNGRDYLMRTRPENITVEDALEALGYRRDGLGDAY
jgi:hypothetical protein